MTEAKLPEVMKSNDLMGEAAAGCDATPAFWLRGLPPSSWYTPPGMSQLPVAELWAWSFGEAQTLPFSQKIEMHGRTSFVDESGGEDASDVRTRRCGWGAAWLGDGTRFKGGWSGTLPGQCQTPLRATIFAAIFILERCEGDVTIAPDCKTFLDKCRQDWGAADTHGAHADLWAELRAIVRGREARGEQTSLLKVKAHLTEQQAMERRVPIEQFVGNKLADVLAGRAAARGRLAVPLREHIAALDRKVDRVHRRIVAINSVFLDKCTGGDAFAKPEGRQRMPELRSLIEASPHAVPGLWSSIRKAPKSTRCLACGQSASRSTLKAWLKRSQKEG